MCDTAGHEFSLNSFIFILKKQNKKQGLPSYSIAYVAYILMNT